MIHITRIPIITEGTLSIGASAWDGDFPALDSDSHTDTPITGIPTIPLTGDGDMADTTIRTGAMEVTHTTAVPTGTGTNDGYYNGYYDGYYGTDNYYYGRLDSRHS